MRPFSSYVGKLGDVLCTSDVAALLSIRARHQVEEEREENISVHHDGLRKGILGRIKDNSNVRTIDCRPEVGQERYQR